MRKGAKIVFAAGFLDSASPCTIGFRASLAGNDRSSGFGGFVHAGWDGIRLAKKILKRSVILLSGRGFHDIILLAVFLSCR